MFWRKKMLKQNKNHITEIEKAISSIEREIAHMKQITELCIVIIQKDIYIGYLEEQNKLFKQKGKDNCQNCTKES